MAPRIALIHALRHSPSPIVAAFAQHWPEATLQNLLDDSLSADLARDGALTKDMTGRFLSLAGYAVETGADGILFTCSAFGPCIDAVRQRFPGLPVLKPNEAMIAEAAASGGAIGLMATFAPTLRSMPPEFPGDVALTTHWVPNALDALDAGDGDGHDHLCVEAAKGLGCDVIALAQFSMARAAGPIRTATGKTVLTTPESALRALRRQLTGH